MTVRLYQVEQVPQMGFLFPNFIFKHNRMGCDSSQMAAEIEPSPATQHSIDRAREILDNPNKNSGQQMFQSLLTIGEGFFRDGNYVQAIRVYQKIIQEGYTVDFDISGVGCAQNSISRYEWFVYRWYNEQQTTGKIKGNAFDALSLCYNIIRNSNEDETERGILWYQDMIAMNETNEKVELLIGYANILYNRSRFEAAIKTYNKVIEKRPSLVNAYVGIALTYEYRRIEKPKAIEISNKIISEVDPENMYAHFILARNQKDVDVKIQKLKVVADKYPQYVRVTNQIGICYGGTKKLYRQAIPWYTKCTQITPEYASCYNNIGVNHELLKEYEIAMDWYFKACEYDHQYKTAHVNVSDVFDHLQFTDEDIFREMKKYPKLDPFMFYYYLGLAYYDKKDNNTSLKWFKVAEAMNGNNFKLMNSMGITYDEMRDFANGEKYYLKCIELNPKYYSAYYNLAILYKNQERIDDTITWYKKAIDANPRYSYAYNNLGNIYKNKQEYKKAVQCYRNAVENLSTYTLAYANMAICLLQLDKHQQAFAAFKRAKQLLPTDNNNLSESNKVFLKQNLEKFDKQGEKWRKTGSIDPEQRQALRALIVSFQSQFNRLYKSNASLSVSDAKALKKEIIQIVNRIYQDQFSLGKINEIYEFIKHIFHDDEEYFHIIPQMFIQYFYNGAFSKNRPISELESDLKKIIKDISQKESSNGKTEGGQSYSLNVKMRNFNPPNDYKVNLFKETSFFSSYEVLYSEIDKVNKLAQQSLPEFIQFVEAVRKRSNGIPYGVNMKLPKDTAQQFKVILRILEKMFKKEITQERVRSIITKIDVQLRKKGSNITLLNIVHEIMEVWTKQITLILEKRQQNHIETTCGMSDLVRGKIMFNSVDDLAKAIDACDKLCHLRGYEVLQLDNRLSKPQTMDVVLKIKVKEAVCEFQLAMRQDESKYHLIHSIYQIERSPLGCIFGSYLFMSKGFSYPLLANCKDIQARLSKNQGQNEKRTVEAARYIIKALEGK